MEPKKLPFIIGGIAMALVMCGAVIILATGFPDPDVTTSDIFVVMTATALLVAMAVTTLYGIVTAFRDRDWLWFALIIISAPISPANLILALVYLRKVRRDAGTDLPGAGWHRDPTGSHQLRYWNGSQWTEIVSNHGNASIDPMPNAPGCSNGHRGTVAT